MAIQVLVVDDSPFIRKAIVKMLQTEADIHVVGEATNGREAVEKVKSLKPDVVTMDVEMPVMDGISALKEIMRDSPTPVIMVSSLTENGAKTTLEALKFGAIDYLPKDITNSSLSIMNKRIEIIAKIRSAVTAKRRLRSRSDSDINVIQVVHTRVRSQVEHQERLTYRILAIGTSTGGPPALERVITRLPADFPIPVLIVQHMPPVFTRSLAERLDSLSQIRVKEAEEGETIQPGKAYIAPGNQHMSLRRLSDLFTVRLSQEPAALINRPSVDVMMDSCADYFNKDLLGVIMTGMGHDGLTACRRIRKQQGTLIAQNEDTCVVFGMPGSIVRENLPQWVLPLDDIAPKIVELVYGEGKN